MTSGRVNPFVNRQPLKTGGRVPFMVRVREALGHDKDASPSPAEEPPVRDERLIRQWSAADAGRVERWMEKARVNGMTVERAVVGEVSEKVMAILAKHGVKKCLLNARGLDEETGVARELANRRIEFLRWGTGGCREEAMTCDAAVTDCRAGLADAGSVLVWSDEGFGRSSTLVVPVHVVLLPESRILADMIDGLELVMRESGGNLPSNVVIINGPSKTADIEMNMITGVHGPKFLYVVVIRD